MSRRAWEIRYNPQHHAYVVLIGGSVVLDENGKAALYHPPEGSKQDYDRWRVQVARSIERLSGSPCKVEL